MRFRVLSAALFFGLFLSLAGCTAFRPPPADIPGLPPAMDLAGRIFDAPRPATFRGIGRVRIDTPEGSRSARIAFFGEYPDRLRIELLSPSGAPLFRLASDALYLYMLSVPDSAYYRTRLGDADLKRLVQVPVKPAEIVALLAGQPYPFDYRYLRLEKADGGAAVISLVGALRVDREKILLEPDLATVRSVQAFGPFGEYRYTARFEEMQAAGPYTVPKRLSFTGEGGRSLVLFVDRYEADVTPPDGVFAIPPPARPG